MGARLGRASRWAGAPRPAFTLLELLVVVTIIGVVGAIAAPRLGGSSSVARLRAAADRIEADLALARAHARRTSQTTTVTFAAGTYRLDDVPDLASGATGSIIMLDKPPYGVTMRATGLGAGDRLTFTALGAADASPVIRLEHGGLAVDIAMNATTGLTSRSSLEER